jgi:hypothetical protein
LEDSEPVTHSKKKEKKWDSIRISYIYITSKRERKVTILLFTMTWHLGFGLEEFGRESCFGFGHVAE